MPQNEVTGERPSNFSQWHRPHNGGKVPGWCAFADVDWAEVRDGQVVAFLETIEIDPANMAAAGDWIRNDPWLHSWYPPRDTRYPLWPTKKAILNYLIAVCKVPFYVVYHTPDMRRAKVIDYRRKTIREYDEDGLAAWIQML